MERGSGRYKTIERKNRKSGSTIFYLTLTPVQQGTRRKSTYIYIYIYYIYIYTAVSYPVHHGL